MRDIKRSHEQLALRSSESNNVIEAEFVDYSLSETKCFPESLSALTLDACDHANEEFFNDSIYYMTLIAQLPRKSREFYVYALSRAAYYEYSISFSWMELARHLRVSEEQVLKEIGILENHKLMRREMEDLRYKDLCWFQFFDCKDNGVFFLKAVLDAFGDDIELLYDTFCEMNFSNLES
ncbi:hypothetical protein OC503_19355 [Vibrio vulnificus]|nr:hypothetical protein [Vibrio vulnificus]EME0077308.1 hypothetical protein [Vibrio vulnificus]MCU8365271.1 hypothetical protein [Vibrio vulnificus]MCU8369443.1 hypothetical protein [Vibrio vulnificus]